MKLLREPLVQFFFIGATIYLLYGVFSKPGPAEANKTITVSAGEIEWMQTSWRVLPYSIGSVAAFWTIQRVGSFM